MKNPVIKSHFEKNGFATTWRAGGLILHPQILATDYAGEIGEEAFKAILLHYTDCSEETSNILKVRITSWQISSSQILMAVTRLPLT